MQPVASPRYQELQKEPKAELHIHAGGSFPIKWLFTQATAEQKANLTHFVEKLKGGMPYEAAFGVFSLIGAIVNSTQKLEEGTYWLMEELKQDGITFVELRSGIKRFAGEDEEAYVKALLQGLELAKNDTFTGCLLLSVQRESSYEYVRSTVELALRYKEKGVRGIDISGVSTRGDITPILGLLKEAKKAGLRITSHIGESYEEKDQMLILRELEPDRVGHAVCLTDEAKAWIKERKIPVEVCPTSAKLVSMHDKNDWHPWLIAHRDEGHPVVLGSDDPTAFGITLTDEYYSLRSLLRMEQIKQLAQESFTHAFL